MTRLPAFSGCVMLLYGMAGDSAGWGGRHARFLGEVYAGEELQARYRISEKKDSDDGGGGGGGRGSGGGYGILAVDYEITRTSDGKLVVVCRRNLYRIKK